MKQTQNRKYLRKSECISSDIQMARKNGLLMAPLRELTDHALSIIDKGGNPRVINFLLARVFYNHLHAHALKSTAIDYVHKVQLDQNNVTIPFSFFTGPFIVESVQSCLHLVGDLHAIIGYPCEDGLWTIITSSADPDKDYKLSVYDRLTLEEIEYPRDEGDYVYRSYTGRYQEAEEHIAPSNFVQAMEFLRKFHYLLTLSTNTPFSYQKEKQIPSSKGKKGIVIKDVSKAWYVNYVSLKEPAEIEPTPVDAPPPPPPPQVLPIENEVRGVIDKSRCNLADTPVRGHMRRQRCGPGRSQIKDVFIPSHTSKRWKTPNKLTIVSTSTKELQG